MASVSISTQLRDLWQNQETTGYPELTCSVDDNHLDHLKVRIELALGHEH